MKKIITGIALIILAFLSGFLLNGLLNMESSVENADVERKIAIVNNDNSVVTEDGESINYGQYFSEKLFNTEHSDDYFEAEIVSMDEAEAGLEGTHYSGYVVFPEDFSENIVSINTDTPTQSLITYKINNTLYEEGQELTEKTILNEIYYVDNQVNYLYIKDQFEQLADTQDEVEEIDDVSIVEQATIDQYANEIDAQFELYAEQVEEEEDSYNEQRETVVESFDMDTYEPVVLADLPEFSDDNGLEINTDFEDFELDPFTIQQLFTKTDDQGNVVLDENGEYIRNASDEIYNFGFVEEENFQNTTVNYPDITDEFLLTSEVKDTEDDNENGSNEDYINVYDEVEYYQNVAAEMKEELASTNTVDIDYLELYDTIVSTNIILNVDTTTGVMDYSLTSFPHNETLTNTSGTITVNYSYSEADYENFLQAIGYIDEAGNILVTDNLDETIETWKQSIDETTLASYCASTDENPLKDISCDIADAQEQLANAETVIDDYVDFERYASGEVKLNANGTAFCPEHSNIACELTDIIDDYYINPEEEALNKIYLWNYVSNQELILENIDKQINVIEAEFNGSADEVETLVAAEEKSANEQVDEIIAANNNSAALYIDDSIAAINENVDLLNQTTEENNAALEEMFSGEDCAMCVSINSISNTSNVTGVYQDLLATYANTNTTLHENYNNTLEPFYEQLGEFKVGGQINTSHLNLIANPIDAEEEENQNSIIEIFSGESITITDIIIMAVIILAIIGLLIIRFLGKKNE